MWFTIHKIFQFKTSLCANLQTIGFCSRGPLGQDPSLDFTTVSTKIIPITIQLTRKGLVDQLQDMHIIHLSMYVVNLYLNY